MIRKTLGIFLGVLFLVGSYFASKILINANQRTRKEVSKAIKKVYTRPVVNGNIPILVRANGNLVASRKIELYAEVQGVLQESKKHFKTGQFFKKGDILMRMDSKEYYSGLLAQRSALYDLIAGMMPDIRFDYPKAFDRWDAYLKSFNINKNVRPLPQTTSDREKFFVTGKQIMTTYYNVKNQEERLEKYTIRAPFDGVLTESLVNSGTLVRSGQKLGEFVSLKSFELEVAVNAEYFELIQIGEQVRLTNLSGDGEWIGVVKRVNGRLDQETQTVKVFIAVSGSGLVEGMYLEAHILIKSETNAIEIERSLLINDREVFIVENNALVPKQIIPVHYTEKRAIIKGLANGTQIIIRPVIGGYPGMPVEIVSDAMILTQ